MAVSLKIPLWMNFIGRFGAGLVSLLVTPLYLRWLGVEGFGLIGFYVLLQTVLGFFSAGVTDAANREIALQTTRAGVSAKRAAFGPAAWIVGLLGGVIVAAGSGWIAEHWLKTELLDTATVTLAIRLMAVLFTLQARLDFHVGAFLGEHRPIAANLVLAGSSVARALVAVMVLSVGPRTVTAFFWSQVITALAVALTCELVVWLERRRERPQAAEPMIGGLRGSFAFSVGMAGVAFTTMLLGQADRIVLSRVLPLEEFGVYSLAATLANLVYLLVTPVQATYYPAFTRHTQPEQSHLLGELYHQACQRMALLVLPVSAVLIFFAGDVLALWTGRDAIAQQAAPVVMFLVGARLISGLNSLPYTLQFAHGRTRFVLRANTAAIVLFLPAVYLLAREFGAVGAAGGYLLLSLPFLGFIVWRTHREILPGHAAQWLWRDTGPICVVAFASAAFCKWIQPDSVVGLLQGSSVALAGGLTLTAALLVNKSIRIQLWRGLQSLGGTKTP